MRPYMTVSLGVHRLYVCKLHFASLAETAPPLMGALPARRKKQYSSLTVKQNSLLSVKLASLHRRVPQQSQPIPQQSQSVPQQLQSMRKAAASNNMINDDVVVMQTNRHASHQRLSIFAPGVYYNSGAAESILQVSICIIFMCAYLCHHHPSGVCLTVPNCHDCTVQSTLRY